VNDVAIRRAGPADADAVADVYLASLAATYDFTGPHSPAEIRRWIAGDLLQNEECWVAETADGSVVAMMALTHDFLDQLYVAPGHLGRGIGRRLVEVAKERRPHGLELYTFQVNARARRFYTRNGFVEVAFGDGSGNEERQPDVRLAWRPAV